MSVIDDASNLISEMDEFDESINRPDTRKASAMSQNSVASGYVHVLLAGKPLGTTGEYPGQKCLCHKKAGNSLVMEQ